MRKKADYKSKICERCEVKYKPRSGAQRQCLNCMPKTNNERSRQWVKDNPARRKEIEHKYDHGLKGREAQRRFAQSPARALIKKKYEQKHFMPTTYKIEWKSVPHKYAGHTDLGFEARKSSHLSDLRKGRHNNWKLQFLFDWLGEEDIIITPLLICNETAEASQYESALFKDIWINDPEVGIAQIINIAGIDRPQ